MNPATHPSRLRIVQVLPSLGVGGAENMAAHLMTGLSADHDVTAVALYRAGNSAVEQRLKEAGVALRHLQKRRGADFRMFSALGRVLEELRPHVVHTHLHVLRYVLPVLWRRPAPVAVHTLHNAAEHEADWAGRLIQRVAFRKTVVPVAISGHGAASFARVYRRACPAVIPNSIPVRHYERAPEAGIQWRAQQGLGQDAIVFICVGRLEEQKNPEGLLAAFHRLNEERAHLFLLGEGSLRERIAGLARSCGLGGRVHLLGKRSDIPECLAASDVFVLASHWEGNPLAVMEAMAAGLPVVSTAAGGVPELVAHGREGLLVAPRDIDGLARAMRRLAADPLERRAMGAAAKARARAEFNVESMTRRYAALYYGLLAGMRPSAAWETGRALSADAAGNHRP